MLATCIAALISVLVTAAVAFPLALRSANDALRTGLADKASLAASLINPPTGTGAGAPIRAAVVVRQLRRQDVNAYLVHNGRSDPAGLPARVIDQITAGRSIVGGSALIAGRRNLVEARSTGSGDGIVLVAPAVPVTAPNLVARIGIALLAGLLAGLLVGALLARRLARPIRNAATVAARLSAGDRSVRLRPEPPAEAEDLAHAINGLAAALKASEGRQRDFLLSISHELRTPLTSLKGYAEALSDGVIGADGAQRAGQTMLAEAGNLERLVTDLLALARLEAADFPVESVPVELIQLVRRHRRGLGRPVRRRRHRPAYGVASRTRDRLHRPGSHPAGDRRPPGERVASAAHRRADRAGRTRTGGGRTGLRLRRGPRRRTRVHRRRSGRGLRTGGPL